MKCEYCSGTGEVQDAREVGRGLKRLRLKGGFALRDFARGLGISHTYLSQLEGGTRRWRLSLINRYTQLLQTKTKR